MVENTIARCKSSFFFFFNDTATTEIYTLSLHDALPIYWSRMVRESIFDDTWKAMRAGMLADRKSTRLNSSHGYISYAVFCLKKKKKRQAHCHLRRPNPSLVDVHHRRSYYLRCATAIDLM